MNNFEPLVHEFTPKKLVSPHDFKYSLCSFWSENNPLTKVSKDLEQLTINDKELKDPLLRIISFSSAMYRDLYHNGGGRSELWAISKPFKKAIREAGLPREVIKSLEARLSKAFYFVARGRGFGLPRIGCKIALMYYMEKFASDCVYYVAKEKNMI